MRTPWILATAAALLISGSAFAQNMSLNQFPHRVEPVLLKVDAKGAIDSMSPAYKLTPKLENLLRANLGEMITKPATDKAGKPIPSQFVMNVALLAQKRADGNYNVRFAYVSTAPVPPGSWYWMHLDGDRLALASQDMRPHGMRIPIERYRGSYRPEFPQNHKPNQQPANHVPPVRQSTQSIQMTSPPSTPMPTIMAPHKL